MDLKNCAVGGDARFVSLWHQVCDDAAARERAWIAELRAAGVKAAHPDDGWVDRERNRMFFCYPQFNDGAEVGDLVALGHKPWGNKPECHRIVRLTKREDDRLLGPWWHFAEEPSNSEVRPRPARAVEP